MSNRRWRPPSSTTTPRRSTGVSTQLLVHVTPEALWARVLQLWTQVCNDESLPAPTREHLSRELHRALMGIAESGTRRSCMDDAHRAVVQAEAALAAVGPTEAAPACAPYRPDTGVFFGD